MEEPELWATGSVVVKATATAVPSFEASSKAAVATRGRTLTLILILTLNCEHSTESPPNANT